MQEQVDKVKLLFGQWPSQIMHHIIGTTGRVSGRLLLESHSFGNYRSEGQFLGVYFTFGSPQFKFRISVGMILSYQTNPLFIDVAF